MGSLFCHSLNNSSGNLSEVIFSCIAKRSCIFRMRLEPLLSSVASHQNRPRLKMPLVASEERWRYGAESRCRLCSASSARMTTLTASEALVVAATASMLPSSQAVRTRAVSSTIDTKRYEERMNEGRGFRRCSRGDSTPRASAEQRPSADEAMEMRHAGDEAWDQRTTRASCRHARMEMTVCYLRLGRGFEEE